MEKKLYSSPCTGIQSHPITQCKSHTTVFSYTCNHAPSTVLLSERFFSLYYKGFFYKLIRRVDLRFYSHPQICHVARATGLAECIFGARAQLASLGASAISTPASTGLQKLPVGAVGDKVRCGAIAPPRPPPFHALWFTGCPKARRSDPSLQGSLGQPPQGLSDLDAYSQSNTSDYCITESEEAIWSYGILLFEASIYKQTRL